MALLGPMVVVAESSAADLLDVLGKAGAFPIVETRWADAPAAIGEIQPVALAIADARGAPSPQHVGAVIQCVETRGGPVTPVIALVENNSSPVMPSALPIALDDSTDRLIARLRSALRIRTLHATVLRRSRTAGAKKRAPAFIPPDLLDEATVLCVGRGGSYPALSVAIGERVGLIGALTIETAARYLNARDVDGIVIGEGLGPRVVSALLTMLAENARFRDLPVGVLDNSAVDDERLPNLVRVEADPTHLVERVLPFVRLQAFEGQLTRVLKSLESEGVIDPDTGLLAAQAFWRDLGRAVQESEETGGALSVARFTFDGVADRRAYVDAARLFSRLVRNVDFACREQDGSILAAFTKTDLRSAHLVARRIASVLRRTMLSPGRDRRAIRPAIALRPDIAVEMRFWPYFLNPWVPREGISRKDYLATKFGSPERYRSIAQRVSQAAAAEGLTYNLDSIKRQPNTLDCHRLILWAGETGNAARMKQRLMDLYFTEGGDLTDREVLVAAAAACGLDAERRRARLASEDDVERVTREANSAKDAGIDGVPCFILGDRIAVQGAQAPEYLAQAIERAANEYA